jgi:thiol-disulfide isomerase/thioredoxin
MRRCFSRILLLGLLGTLVLSAGCGGDDDETTSDAKATAGSGAVGERAPDVRLARLDGSPLELGDLRGKAVLVDFWATWCGPCIRALPHLMELDEQYEDLVVVGIAMDTQGKAVVAPFVEKRGVTIDVVLATAEVVAAFGGVDRIPTTFLIAPSGEITEKWIGARPKQEYEQAVQKVLEI